MASIYVLAIALLISILCAFTDGARRFGIIGLVLIILATGAMLVARLGFI